MTAEQTISGYLIEVSMDSSAWSDLESDTQSTTTTYSHTGLTAGSTRHYRVSAINSSRRRAGVESSPTPLQTRPRPNRLAQVRALRTERCPTPPTTRAWSPTATPCWRPGTP